MSRVEDLITEYCPNGVEYMHLGDIEDIGLIKLGRGSVISKKDIAADPGDFPIYSSSASGVGEFGRYSKYMFDDERLSWSVDGGGRFFYRHAHRYSVTNVSGWLKVLKPNRLDIKYLYYVLDSSWATKKFDYTRKAHPSVIRNEYKIPIPPLEVQSEIVGILDKFTQLETELSDELKARQKQYVYYRKLLLDESSELPSAKVVRLGDVCRFQNGFAFKSSLFRKEGTPILRITNIQGDELDDNRLVYCDESDYRENLQPYRVEKGDVVVAMSGATTGKVGVNNTDNTYYLNQRVGKFVPDENVLLSQYLYFVLLSKSKEIYEMAGGGAQPNLSTESIKKMAIPVPPINEQSRIVKILEKYDKLINDVHVGIPAELKARRNQYEHYRTKLLAFQELPA